VILYNEHTVRANPTTFRANSDLNEKAIAAIVSDVAKITK